MFFNDEDDDGFQSANTAVGDEDIQTVAATTTPTLDQFPTRESENLSAISIFEVSTTTVAVTTTSTQGESIEGSYNYVTSSDSALGNKEISAQIPAESLREENMSNSVHFESLKQRDNLNESSETPTNSTFSRTTSDDENLSNNEKVEDASTTTSVSTFVENSSRVDDSSATTTNETQNLLVIAPVDLNFNGALELVEDSDLTTPTVEEVTTTSGRTTDIEKITRDDIIIQSQAETIASRMSTTEDEERFKAERRSEDDSDETATSSGNLDKSVLNEPSENNSKDDSVITAASVTSDTNTTSSTTYEQQSEPTKNEDPAEDKTPEGTNVVSSESDESSPTVQAEEKADENATSESSIESNFEITSEETSVLSAEEAASATLFNTYSLTPQSHSTIQEQVESASKSSVEEKSSRSPTFQNENVNLTEELGASGATSPPPVSQETLTEVSPDTDYNLPAISENFQASDENAAISTRADTLNSPSTEATEDSPTTEATKDSPTTVGHHASTSLPEEKSADRVIADEASTTTSSNSIEDETTQVITQIPTSVEKSTSGMEGGVTENPEKLQTKPLNSTNTLNTNVSEATQTEENPPEINDAANKATRAEATEEPLIQVKVGKVKKIL